MSLQYAVPTPVDSTGMSMAGYPAAKVALEEDMSENNSVSSVITLTDNTTVIEVSASGSGAALKWIATTNTNPSVVTAAGATADFDHVIPNNTYRRFVVPIESRGTASIVGANKQHGLYNRVAVISMGIGSVLTLQF